jgi:hypothetical protein
LIARARRIRDPMIKDELRRLLDGGHRLPTRLARLPFLGAYGAGTCGYSPMAWSMAR